jgi:ABC-type polysaccharide/polyol phosphate transport system ATPase subunit
VSGEIALRVDGLSKRYRRMAPGDRLRTLKSALLQRSLTTGLEADEAIEALSGVSFDVRRGEAFGLVGGNGSGKSTLLKILAGILKPSHGSVEVRGRVAALIELGAGFHPEISGRENVFINGALLGLGRREIERRFDEIVAFSGLADFIDEPVKNYSSGMYVRLGFAVAVHTDPDILLVDEVLAVGDEEFGHRCLRRIEEMLAAGKTLLFVSHSLDLVEHLCDRALWLDGGVGRLEGEPRRVIDAYRQAVAEAEGRQHREENVAEAAATLTVTGDPLRWGTGVATIEAARLLDSSGAERYNFRTGEDVTIELAVAVADGGALDDFVLGVAINTPRGLEVWGTNTELAGFAPERLDGAATARLRCPGLRLGSGDYTLDAAVHARDGAPYDYRRRILGFRVDEADDEARGVGVYMPRHEWRFEGAIRFERDGERRLSSKPLRALSEAPERSGGSS